MSPPANVIELRRILAEKFPSAHPASRPSRPRVVPTGVAALDALLGGGMPKGEITELVGEGHGSGTAQVIHALLGRVASDGLFLVLVDGADSFDVDVPTPEALARLLWVRCRTAEEALKAADLVLRDRNFPLVILDLKLNPAAQLRRVSSSVWHRLGRLAEHQGCTLLVVTPFPLVGGVAVRVEVRAEMGVEALDQAPSEVVGRLRFELVRAVEGMKGAGA